MGCGKPTACFARRNKPSKILLRTTEIPGSACAVSTAHGSEVSPLTIDSVVRIRFALHYSLEFDSLRITRAEFVSFSALKSFLSAGRKTSVQRGGAAEKNEHGN